MATISLCFAPACDRDRVEERLATASAKPSLRKPAASIAARRCTRARDLRQPFRAVIDGVHRGHHRQQHLRGADVGGRLFAADVLLAGLQRQPIGRLPARIDRHADDAAGHRALERVARRDIGGVRAAIAHRHAEALRRADGDVGAEFAGRGEQRQRQQIGGHDGERALGVQRRDRRPQVAHRARCARILQERRRTRRPVEVGEGIADDRRPAERLGARAQHRDGLRMQSASTKNDFALRLRGALGHRHGFGRGGASSSSEALAMSSPVRSQIMVWKLSSASSRPWLISG